MGKRNLCGLGLIAAKGGGPGFNLRGSSKPLNCQTPTLIENFCPFYRYFSMKGLFWADESPFSPSPSPSKRVFHLEKRGIPSLSLKTFALFTVTFQWKAN